MKIGRYTGLGFSRRTPVPEKQPASPTPKKKALLIGITYADSGTYVPLRGPHADVQRMRKLLIEQYGYAVSEIVTLLDSGEGVQPTRANILRAIGDLVRGARKGDRFFFHYCGHTTQMENRSNSEEDGMDECLVPMDGEDQKIMDNELRRHLVDALPIGSSLVAVFDSCHSASLLDLAHYRCNRVYVPWISKGRRRSDELWNANVRRRALMLPLSPAGSPPATRANTHTNLNALPLPPPPPPPTKGEKAARRATRRATREMRELAQLLEGADLASPNEVPTRTNSPEVRSPLGDAVVTTRRIYEAARTSPQRVRAWRTDVGELAVLGERGEGAEGVPEVQRAGTEGENDGRGERDGAKEKARRRRRARASLPLLSSFSLGSGSFSRAGSTHRENGQPAAGEGVQRRTAVVRARAVSVAVDKENASPAPVVVKKDSAVQPRPQLQLQTERRPVSWLDPEPDAGERACESPEPVWACEGDKCREPGHGHEEGDRAEVISLASCKDYQLSWEDADGGSMTRELVRILERDPHPTLRTLVTNVSHALHRMSLERHMETRRYKRDCKKYAAYLERRRAAQLHPHPAPAPQTDDSASATVADSASASVSVAPSVPTTHPPSRTNTRRKTRPKAPQVKAKSEGFATAPVYDMDNFQDPQVASHHPLDMERPWSM
ncbi:caspase domain-containing protein [Mycena maculata]|uniref:Caspase domain-containing protein n=1 Tax=Mycena maculata TaxID=230809 RepID=A0AAD7K2E7_9AGAR|nr:caspase domain-containing protein [Mycena maculata]